MASYDLTEEAEARVADIYRHSIESFGLTTARRYLNGLHATFGLLAENPHLGAEQRRIDAGIRRFAYQSHVIYYRPREKGVLILDVLHHAQDPSRHFHG